MDDSLFTEASRSGGMRTDPGRNPFRIGEHFDWVSQGSSLLATPYMFFFMDFVFHLKVEFFPSCPSELFVGERCNEGERSEPSGTARPQTIGAAMGPFSGICGNSFPFSSLSAFLAPARLKTAVPAQGTSAACASSCDPWTALCQSVAQPEPRAPRDPNSNRCLSCGSGRKLACIRMSQNTAISI